MSDINNKYNSFESAKSKIISSGLGSALGMTSSTTIADVANKITAVVNRGAVSGSITTSGGSYTIAAGYHNGSGKVTGPTLASLVGSNVNLDSNARLLSGYTAYGKNGTKYTGSIIDRSKVSNSSLGAINSGNPDTPVYQTDLTQVALQSKDNTWRVCMRIPEGYYSKGTQPGIVDCYIAEKTSAFGNAEAGHVVSGRTFTSSAGFRAIGTHTCPSLSSLIGTSATLNSGVRLLSGYTAYGSGGTLYQGSMPDLRGTPNKIQNIRMANGRFEVAVDAGYHGCYWGDNSYEYMDYSQVANAIGLTAAKIVSGNTILGIAGTDGGYNAGYNAGHSAGYTSGVAAGKSSGTVTFIASEKYGKWNGTSGRTYTVPSGVNTVYIFTYAVGGGLTGQSSASITMTSTAGTATTLVESKSGSGSYPNSLLGYKYTGCAGATITTKIKTGNGTGQINGGSICFYLS